MKLIWQKLPEKVYVPIVERQWGQGDFPVEKEY